MSSEKVHAEQLESGSVQPEKKRRFCGFCRWYYWLAGVCLFVLVFMLIVAFAIIPAVAQKKVDKSYLKLNSLDILEPRPEGFALGINSTLEGAHSVKATIDAFTADFYLKEHKPYTPFIQVELPKVSVGKGTTYISVKDRATDVIDGEAFEEFSKALFELEEFSVSVKGKSKIHVAAFKSNIDYKETVTTKGVNGLKGMKINSFSIKSKNDGPDGSNLVGKVLIKNPSVVTIQTGNVDFAMLSEGKEIGTGTLPDLKLIPGDHEYDFYAKGELSKVVGLISLHKEGEPLYIQILGKKVTYKGTEIPWLTKILASKAIDCELGGL